MSYEERSFILLRCNTQQAARTSLAVEVLENLVVTVHLCWILLEEDCVVMMHYLLMTGRNGMKTLCLDPAL